MPESKIDEQGNELHTDGVFIVKRALIGSAWCCAPKHMTVEQVQLAVHRQCEPYIPAMHGTDLTPWTVVPKESDDSELVSPGHCAECPDSRQHWLLIGGVSGVFMMALCEQSDGVPEDLKVQDLEDYLAARND